MNFWQHPLIKGIGPAQFNNLFHTTPASAVGISIAATIVAMALAREVNLSEILLWWTFNIVCTGYSLICWHKNKNKKPRRTSRREIIKLMITSVIFALPWAFMIIRYLGNVSHGNEIIVIAAMAGMAASGGIQLSKIYPAALTYLAVLTSAGVAKSLYLNTTDYYLTAVIFLSYSLFLKQVITHSSQLSIDRAKAIDDLELRVIELDKTKADLQTLAMEDILTGLPNRREFQEHLSASLSEASQLNTSMVLLICDVDHFKNINDISGHATGDALLKIIARRLRKTVASLDFVARIGGDEFAIIAKNHKSPKETAEYTQNLLNVINHPVTIDGKAMAPGMSIGISMYPYDAGDKSAILSHADLALHRCKMAGRGQYSFFDQKMKLKLSTDQIIETDLRMALVDQQFELVYQPKVSIRTGNLQGFEALLRWRKNDGTLAAPGEFFQVAEERGLMAYICDFVMERALKDYRDWLDQGYNPGKISINIHPVQIKDLHRMKKFVRDVERSGINPDDIYLEITEGCVIGRGTENIPALLEYLSNKGFRISLDDFGTGFASAYPFERFAR